MKTIARMYRNSVAHPGNDWRNYPVPATGSDSVMPLDGMHSQDQQIAAAKAHAVRLNSRLGQRYVGVRIYKGISVLDAQPVTPVIPI